jgi:serine/threonine-protein kinase
VARFEREVQLTAQLTHPNTVAVYDFGRTPDDLFYYAMEYLHGINLADLVDQTGPQPAGRVIHALQQVCGSLSEAHAIGLIHRDIKPANIILCNRGGVQDFVKVVDFGIVKVIDGNATQLTQTGMLSGTPLYIAPEALRDPGQVDARIDVYALGGVAYFMITGRTIFPEDLSLVDVLTHQLGTVPVVPSRIIDGVPADLEGLIMRCLEKDPDARPASTGELFAELSDLHDAGSWDRHKAEKWWALHSDLAGFSTTGEDIVASSKVMRARVVDHGAVSS